MQMEYINKMILMSTGFMSSFQTIDIPGATVAVPIKGLQLSMNFEGNPTRTL
jgi:hypothetical protein